MRERQEIIEYCLSYPRVYEDYPFSDMNWTCMRHEEDKKVFAWIFYSQGYIWINVKGEKGWLDFLEISIHRSYQHIIFIRNIGILLFVMGVLLYKI